MVSISILVYQNLVLHFERSSVSSKVLICYVNCVFNLMLIIQGHFEYQPLTWMGYPVYLKFYFYIQV